MRSLQTQPKKAFTLVELLTVVTVIGILAGLFVGTIGWSHSYSARKKSEANLRAIELALAAYKLDYGTYPQVLNKDNGASELYKELITNPEVQKKRPYLNVEKSSGLLDTTALTLKDGFGHAYYYICPGSYGPYDLWSYGQADFDSSGGDKNKWITNW